MTIFSIIINLSVAMAVGFAVQRWLWWKEQAITWRMVAESYRSFATTSVYEVITSASERGCTFSAPPTPQSDGENIVPFRKPEEPRPI